MPDCLICNDTGRVGSGNNEFPCSKGATALFNCAGVSQPVTGRALRHLFKSQQKSLSEDQKDAYMATHSPFGL